jgi:integrase
MSVKVRERDGKWWIFTDHNKQRVARCLGSGKVAKKAAEDAAVQIAARLAIGDTSALEKQAAPSTVPTFAEVAKAWPEWSAGLYPVRPGTQKSRDSFTKVHLVPWFGAKPITDVTRGEIQSFIASKRAAGLADSFLRVGLVTLSLILGYAVERGDIPANPMKGGARLWKPNLDAPPDPFTRTELQALLLAADVIDPRWGLVVTVCGTHALRSGEIRGLDGGDLVDGALTVRRTYTKRQAGPPKTPRGIRTVPIRDAALLGQITAQAPADPAAPLFPSLTRAGRMQESELERLWARTVKAAGVRPRPFKNLRATSDSVRLSDGENPPQGREGVGAHRP